MRAVHATSAPLALLAMALLYSQWLYSTHSGSTLLTVALLTVALLAQQSVVLRTTAGARSSRLSSRTCACCAPPMLSWAAPLAQTSSSLCISHPAAGRAERTPNGPRRPRAFARQPIGLQSGPGPLAQQRSPGASRRCRPMTVGVSLPLVSQGTAAAQLTMAPLTVAPRTTAGTAASWTSRLALLAISGESGSLPPRTVKAPRLAAAHIDHPTHPPPQRPTHSLRVPPCVREGRPRRSNTVQRLW